MGRSILPKPLPITDSPTHQAAGDPTNRVFSVPPSPEMPMCAQSPTMASVIGTNSSSAVSKPYRKILPAPTRDSTPILLRRASEIMNRKTSTVLSNSPTHLQATSAAVCNASPMKRSSAVGIVSTQTPQSSAPCEPPEPANESSNSETSVCNRATEQTVSSSSSPKLTLSSESTSVSPFTTPEFSQSSSSCLSESNEGKSKSSPSVKQPLGTAELSSVQPQATIVSSASPPPLLLFVPQSTATNSVTALNQLGGPNLSYIPAAKPLYTNGNVHVSTSVPQPSGSKTSPSINVMDGTDCDPHSQSKSGPAVTPLVTYSIQQRHTSPPKAMETNTAPLATCGTFHSPNKETHSRSFVNVEDFLIPVSESPKPQTLGQGLPRVRKADIRSPPPLLQLKPKASCGNVPLLTQEQLAYQMSQVNPLVGVQPLPSLSWRSIDQQSHSRNTPNTVGSPVDQRPVSPATNGNVASQRFDPNTVLAQTSQIFTTPFYSNGANTGTLYPIVTHLPPFSSFYPLRHHSTLTYQQAGTSVHSCEGCHDTSPPKRPRLE